MTSAQPDFHQRTQRFVWQRRASKFPPAHFGGTGGAGIVTWPPEPPGAGGAARAVAGRSGTVAISIENSRPSFTVFNATRKFALVHCGGSKASGSFSLFTIRMVRDSLFVPSSAY